MEEEILPEKEGQTFISNRISKAKEHYYCYIKNSDVIPDFILNKNFNRKMVNRDNGF
jgi:hypothetical protein